MDEIVPDRSKPRRSWFPILLILSALLCAVLALYQYFTLIPPQAEPLIGVFAAVRDQDPEQLELAFSKRIIKRFEKRYMQRGGLSREAMWNRLLSQYTNVFDDETRAYRLDDLQFSYTGGLDRGHVLTMIGGKKLGRMTVLYEDGRWKLDER